MFDLPDNKPHRLDLPVIARDEVVLLFDDGRPILFTGISKYNSHIIGTSVDEDREAGLEWYFHVVVTDEDYFSYTHREVSYLTLLQQASVLFVIEKDAVGDREDRIYQIAFTEIPEDYRPLESSYFPNFLFRPSFGYETRLTGKLADAHLAVPREVNKAQISVAALIDTAVEWLERLFGLRADIFLKPATQGSFAISYEIQLDQRNLLVDETRCREYLRDYIEYCLQHLPTDLQELAKVPFDRVQRFNELYELSRSVGLAIPILEAEAVQSKQDFAFSLLTAATVMRALTEDVGGNYNSIQFSSIGSGPTGRMEYPLGSVDSVYKSRMALVSQVIEQKLASLEQEHTTEDSVASWFDVSIYEFNKTTGNGWALVYNELSDSYDKARIAFVNYPYRDKSSLYTESLHSGKKVKVLARASRKPNRSIARLEIVSG